MRRERSAVAFLMAGLLGASAAFAQEAARPSTDLSTKLRFIERYAAPRDKGDPDAIGQYRVAIRETIKQVIEKPQGAPERTEETFQTIYGERAAVLASTGEVTDTVRRYEAFRKTPDPFKSTDRRPLEGLVLWLHTGGAGASGNEPRVMSLTEGRSIHDMEYRVFSRQIFLPELRGLLPAMPSRAGDTWGVSKAATRALLGEDTARGERLTGKLLAVRKSAVGQDLVAEINVTGQFLLASRGNSAVNALILFTFKPPSAPESAPGGGGAVVDAHGAITELRMALSSVAPLSPHRDERFRGVRTHEVILQRQLADSGPALKVPDPPPTPTVENSWLTYDDPAGRFHFRYPQNLQRMMPPPGPDTVELIQMHRAGPDDLSLALLPKTGKPNEDRQVRTPDYHRTILKQEWADEGYEVTTGFDGMLPEADWADAKMKVYHFEAALKSTRRDAKGVQRVYFDFYLAKFGRDECLTVHAMTAQDPPTAFRKQTEEILKSFRLEPSQPKNEPGPGGSPPGPR